VCDVCVMQLFGLLFMVFNIVGAKKGGVVRKRELAPKWVFVFGT